MAKMTYNQLLDLLLEYRNGQDRLLECVKRQDAMFEEVCDLSQNRDKTKAQRHRYSSMKKKKFQEGEGVGKGLKEKPRDHPQLKSSPRVNRPASPPSRSAKVNSKPFPSVAFTFPCFAHHKDSQGYQDIMHMPEKNSKVDEVVEESSAHNSPSLVEFQKEANDIIILESGVDDVELDDPRGYGNEIHELEMDSTREHEAIGQHDNLGQQVPMDPKDVDFQEAFLFDHDEELCEEASEKNILGEATTGEALKILNNEEKLEVVHEELGEYASMDEILSFEGYDRGNIVKAKFKAPTFDMDLESQRENFEDAYGDDQMLLQEEEFIHMGDIYVGQQEETFRHGLQNKQS
ncbi:uncharacterized protein LOC143885321 [Tasmannia lanceolata]|uniref:uncharacterized protein LOC143885321 n=1 Tax=Tasmannia lanceolata TaxID=3420 RepID=UPI004064388F